MRKMLRQYATRGLTAPFTPPATSPPDPPDPGDEVPVGMPLGTEPANVGPTANVLGHTPIAWNDLELCQDTLVITTAMANAATESALREDVDGELRLFKVFRRLNRRVAVAVTSTVDVMIADSRMGMLIAQTFNAHIRSEWNVYTRAKCRDDDPALTAAFIWDGTGEEGLPTTASLNGATEWGTGANRIVVGSDGVFTDTSYRSSQGASLIAYRDNCMGHTDLGFVGDKARMRIIEVWDHDHLWMKTDAARKTFNPNQSHCDVIKINSDQLLQLQRGRTDKWLILNTDYVNITKANHFKGPNWGVMKDDPGYKFFKQGVARIGTAYIISNQVGNERGTLAAATTNTLTLQVGKRAPVNNYYVGFTVRILSGAQSGQSRTITAYNANTGVATVNAAYTSAPAGTYEIDLRAKNCHLEDWIFDGPTNQLFNIGTPVQKQLTVAGCIINTETGCEEIMIGSNTITAADNWRWKTTGPRANKDHNGNVIPAPRANMADSDVFVPVY